MITEDTGHQATRPMRRSNSFVRPLPALRRLMNIPGGKRNPTQACTSEAVWAATRTPQTSIAPEWSTSSTTAINEEVLPEPLRSTSAIRSLGLAQDPRGVRLFRSQPILPHYGPSLPRSIADQWRPHPVTTASGRAWGVAHLPLSR